MFPAPLWRRLISAVYDGLLLLGLWMVAALLDLIIRDALLGLPRYWLWMQLYFFGVGLFFFAWFWVRGGQTLGMRAWRIRVRRIDGMPLKMPVATVRYAVMLLTWAAALAPLLLFLPNLPLGDQARGAIVLVALAAIMSAIPMLRQGRRRAICDWVAGTEVVVLAASK